MTSSSENIEKAIHRTMATNIEALKPKNQGLTLRDIENEIRRVKLKPDNKGVEEKLRDLEILKQVHKVGKESSTTKNRLAGKAASLFQK